MKGKQPQVVKPPVPPKGKAFDLFDTDGGGTVSMNCNLISYYLEIKAAMTSLGF